MANLKCHMTNCRYIKHYRIFVIILNKNRKYLILNGAVVR